MTSPRALVTPSFLAPGDDVDLLLREHGCETVHEPYLQPRSHEDMVHLVRDVDAAIITGDRFTAEVFADAPRLRVVARVGVGYDGVDVEAATARGVVVCNMPGVNRHSVAELSMGLLLLCARHIPENIADVRGGGWQRIEGRELRGSMLGIVGLGTIGRAVARLARAFDMTVLANDRDAPRDEEFAAQYGVTYRGLDDLLEAADYVTLHVFLDAANRHWFGADKLARMKRSAYLINTSRGPVVDEAALCEALGNGTIAGAALDVVEREPLLPDSPLREVENVIITPHIGGVTREARERAARGAAENVLRVLEGREPANVVNTEVLAGREVGRSRLGAPSPVGLTAGVSEGRWRRAGAGHDDVTPPHHIDRHACGRDH